MHYLSTNGCSQSLHFVKNFFWHHLSSCKCSMCLYFVGKVSDSFTKSSGISCFPSACTIWALTRPLLRSKVSKENGYVQNAVILSKTIFMGSNFFMQMSNVSTLCIQSIRLVQYKLWNDLNSLCMHYLCSTIKKRVKCVCIVNGIFTIHIYFGWQNLY